jgi:hypothetical protein
MAAKQGLSAQWSQASEDAKRAISKRTKSSWFSNMNTTCTIKSAPPRSPEILSLLSIKSGYLVKRNEQHIWQNRWCCIVPHMFLYYFDADIGLGPNPKSSKYKKYRNQLDPPSLELQQELNAAIHSGNRKSSAPRTSLNLFPSSSTATTTTATTNASSTGKRDDLASDKYSTLQPSGIIDLECYTTIHQTSTNPLVFELAGDTNENPDLRSFYFHAPDEATGDEWSHALLKDRHNSLLDERDAYQQVCHGFSLQLQQLHADCDRAQTNYEQMQDECYRIRSSHEELRRNCWATLQDTFERSSSTLPSARCFRDELDSIRQQPHIHLTHNHDTSLHAAVQLLSEYCAVWEDHSQQLQSHINQQQNKFKNLRDGNHSQVQELQTLLQQNENAWQTERQELQLQLQSFKRQLDESQTNHKDAQLQLTSQKMEFSIQQSKSKVKIQELTAHKQILKKEVIKLRQRMDELGSELGVLKHQIQSSQTEVTSERRKTQLLEQYVSKVESQVQTQQTMMELMSQSAAASISAAASSSSSFAPIDTASYSHRSMLQTSDSRLPPTGKKSLPMMKNLDQHHTSTTQYQNHYDHHHDYNNNKHDNDEDDDDDDDDNLMNYLPQNHKILHPSTNHHPIFHSETLSIIKTDDEDDDNHTSNTKRETHSVLLQKAMAPAEADSFDSKSHMSELTEDRTHHHHQQQQNALMNRSKDHYHLPPPTYIDASGYTTKTRKKETAVVETSTKGIITTSTTIAPTIEHKQPRPASPIHPPFPSQSEKVTQPYNHENHPQQVQTAKVQRGRSTTSNNNQPNNTSSVNSTPNRRSNRLFASTSSSLSSKNHPSRQPSPSFFRNLGKAITNAIDNSVLGLPDSSSSSSSSSSAASSLSHADDVHSPERPISETSSSLTLAQRQQLQKAQQIAFLKAQGLFVAESQVHPTPPPPPPTTTTPPPPHSKSKRR